ncbi:oxygenase MpaB family protein [Paucibacter sp. APW11]|uniref:Oxygenase MpaB family protein n=1 Tax=Roseateles aquae TaxID=3077235 RepID=A0ABU3PHU5_9BURK|nr:oxygenase MpaB family protein [Paucibacter sp. APW11]MDT9001693.1 oxygenase MpaB family protein [Paucibacter sp. APW11]
MPPAPRSAIEALYYGRRRRLMFRAGTYLALLRSMAVGDLVQHFYRHSALVAHTQARLARTRNTLRQLICHGFDSDEGRQALARLRAAHAGVDASADDYRYVLALFMLEPLRWNEARGGAPLDEAEATLLLDFWARVGEAMGLPDCRLDLAAWRAFQRRYEQQRWCYTPEGEQLARACLREVVTLSLPWGTRGLFRALMLRGLDPALRELLRLPAAPWWARLIG